MARVTDAEVKLIIDTNVSDLTPFITAADQIIDRHVVGHGEGFSTGDLKEISRWLSAHLVAVRDPRTTSESALGASGSFEGRAAQSERGILSTQYGQMANDLSDGALMQAGKRRFQMRSIDR